MHAVGRAGTPLRSGAGVSPGKDAATVGFGSRVPGTKINLLRARIINATLFIQHGSSRAQSTEGDQSCMIR